MSHMAILAADTAGSVYHQFARLQSMTQWWQWLLLVAVCAAVLSVIGMLYFRDSVELPRGVKWLLIALRVCALLGVLFYFLDLEKRTERQLVKNSRVLLLIDTSRSMGLQDSNDATSVPAGPSRIDHVVQELAEGDLLQQLRQQHDVVAYRFDEGAQPVELVSLAKFPDESSPADPLEAAQLAQQQSLRESRWTAAAAGLLLGAALLSLVIYFVWTRVWRGGEAASWCLLVGIVSLIAGVVVLAVASLRSPDVPLLAVLGLQEPPRQTAAEEGSETGDGEQSPASQQIDWREVLTPRGNESRIGDALRSLASRERGGPVAGIVLFSDGRNNAGLQYTVGVAAAQDAGIPVYTVGLGSDRRPVNVRVVDLEAPQRVYPGDRFSMTGYLQAHGLSGRTVRVQLVSADGTRDDADQEETFEQEQRVRLGSDGEVVPLQFEIAPTEQGRRVYKLRVEPPEQDHDRRDDQKSAYVDIVERKNRVLLLAGGPTREYRFLRNLLFRDRDTTLDVLLQSGPPGISQEANNVLYEFPDSAEQLFEYDCIVAFDPDWNALSPSSIELLDRWVAESAGGLVLVAGPVHTPRWSRAARGEDTKIETIKTLYPVVFFSRGSATLNLGRTASETAWPLQFTRDGLEAPFLWLEDDALASEQAWASFEGVYGYQAVKDAKAGARVYAHFSDPSTAVDNELPIYLASQFYGAGRVFFQASGEMWRIRAVDDGYFEKYYTKLIRWASEGRLLRDSSRGVLLVDKDRALLGDHVVVRAMLTDPQHNPLVAEHVAAVLVQPDSTRVPLELEYVKNAARDGMFSGQFTALQEGDYRVELAVPESSTDELLRRDVRVRVPALEIEQPERYDALLKDVADKTGGDYYVGMNAAMNRQGAGRAPLPSLLEPQDQVTYLPGTPDRKFDKLLMTWLMGLIAGALSLEWLIRRLSRLA